MVVESLHGENAKNSFPSPINAGDADGSREPVTVEPLSVRSGVDNFGKLGLIAVAVLVGWSVVVVGIWGLVLLKGREKLRGEGCSGRVLTTFGMRPTWGRRLCFWGRVGLAFWVVCRVDGRGGGEMRISGSATGAGEAVLKSGVA